MKKLKTMSEIALLYYALYYLMDEYRRNEEKVIKFPTNSIFAERSVRLKARLDEIDKEIIRLERKTGK